MLKVQLSIPDLKAQVLALRQMAQDPMAASVNSELHAEAELRRQEVGPRADGLELDRVRIDDAHGGGNHVLRLLPEQVAGTRHDADQKGVAGVDPHVETRPHARS